MTTTTHSPERLDVLRWEVGRLREAERRRRFPVALHVGELGGPRTSLVVPPVAGMLDVATAFDLLDCRLARDAPAEVDVWVTRPGVPELHDHDLLWMAAATGTVAARGASLRSFHAVTRTGWLDVHSGEQRVWKRLRLER